MILADGNQALLLFQDDSDTDFGAQVFLIDNTSDIITATLVVALTGVSTLTYTDFVGVTS